MKVFIKEIKQNKTLELIDPKTNINYVLDFIGNYGALTDGQFTYDDELDAYICYQETFNWWDKVITDNQMLEVRIQELINEHGSDSVNKAIESAGSVDLEDHAACINHSLDEVFGE